MGPVGTRTWTWEPVRTPAGPRWPFPVHARGNRTEGPQGRGGLWAPVHARGDSYMYVGTGPDAYRPEGAGGDAHMHRFEPPLALWGHVHALEKRSVRPQARKGQWRSVHARGSGSGRLRPQARMGRWCPVHARGDPYTYVGTAHRLGGDPYMHVGACSDGHRPKGADVDPFTHVEASPDAHGPRGPVGTRTCTWEPVRTPQA